MRSSFNNRKIALVTGGAKRLGQAIAFGLAEAGWDIVVHYGTSRQEAESTVEHIRTLGRRAVAIQCDLSKEGDVRDLLQNANSVFGKLSCVVNNASLFDYDAVANFSVECLERHMRVNLASPILLAKALHDMTDKGEQAVVINLLDQKLYNLNPDFLSYTLSKAALDSATVMLAQALAPKVRVVGVAPGLTMISHLQTHEEFALTHAMSPLGESSRPEDIAQAVVFAAGNRAMTGTTMLVDGGQHLMRMTRDFSLINRNN